MAYSLFNDIVYRGGVKHKQSIRITNCIVSETTLEDRSETAIGTKYLGLLFPNQVYDPSV